MVIEKFEWATKIYLQVIMEVQTKAMKKKKIKKNND